MRRVSIIVPVYYGEKYIQSLIHQAEECRKCIKDRLEIELILVNDAPDDPLDEQYQSEWIDIAVLNTDVNQGVQSARIRGIEYCKGSYILLLDQDDKIAPEYLKSQMESIGDCDAVVCRVIHEEKPFYNLTRPFKEIICKEYMFQEGDSIISPGQVLMRKEAVSDIWKTNILKNNGADDWMLWLCMINEGKSFALNDEILFEHVVDGNNASLRTLDMHRSELEVLEIIRKSQMFSEEDIRILEETVRNIEEKRLFLMGKFQRISFVYDAWVSLRNCGIHISKYLRQRGYRSIAVYGVTSLGKRLYEELAMDKFEVSYFIDINAPFLYEQIPVYSPEEELRQVDAVVISLVQDEQQITDMLQMKLSADIWKMAELMKKIKESVNA